LPKLALFPINKQATLLVVTQGWGSGCKRRIIHAPTCHYCAVDEPESHSLTLIEMVVQHYRKRTITILYKFADVAIAQDFIYVGDVLLYL
jgi:hypothetical protein